MTAWEVQFNPQSLRVPMVPVTKCGVNPETLVSYSSVSCFALQPAFDDHSKLPHPPSIDAKITLAGSRGRPKMDRLRFIIKHEFDIVHESKQQAPKFVMEVGLVLFNEFRTG